MTLHCYWWLETWAMPISTWRLVKVHRATLAPFLIRLLERLTSLTGITGAGKFFPSEHYSHVLESVLMHEGHGEYAIHSFLQYLKSDGGSVRVEVCSVTFYLLNFNIYLFIFLNSISQNAPCFTNVVYFSRFLALLARSHFVMRSWWCSIRSKISFVITGRNFSEAIHSFKNVIGVLVTVACITWRTSIYCLGRTNLQCI